MCRMPTNSSRVLWESRTIQIIEPICSTAGSPISITNETMPGFLTTSGTFVRDGKVTTLTRYYITSRTLTADQLLEAVRGHWSIENSVHWVLDVVFGDDDQRLRSNYGPRNMALVQRIALNPDQAQALGQGPPHG